ncbi:MAG: type II secretion system protein GspG [Planctomycetes bacterium]|nr:type II secretion system protein GspG [Planctomycetota bacterium]
MLHALLAPLFLCVGTETHPALHPSNADLYIEVNDVQALLKAYEKAPVVQLMNDPAIGKIADVAKEAGVDLRTMMQGLLPVPDASRPDDRFWPWSNAIAASFSLSGYKSVATGTSEQAQHGGGVIALDFKDTAAATQALAAIGASGGMMRVAIEGEEPFKIEARELPIQRFQLSTLEAWFVQDAARIIGGLGAVTPAELAQRLAHPETSFASKRALAIDESGFKTACGTTLLRAWSDLDRMPFVNAPGDKQVEQSLIETFLPGFLPFVGQKGRLRMQLCGDRFVTESLVERIGSAKQLDDLYGSGDIPLKTARMVPAEAVGAWVMKIQPAQFEALLETTLTRTSSKAAVAVDDTRPKISAAVGESVAMFMLPLSINSLNSEAGMIPPVVLAAELKDGAAFKVALDAWIERVRLADPTLKVENKPYHKLPMYTFTLSGAPDEGGDTGGGFGAGLTDSLRPTLTILPDRILLAPNRKTAQAEVRRTETEQTEVHEIAREGAIPKGAFEASTMDWGLAVGKLYDAGRGLLPMLLQGREQPVDVSSLPSASQLFRFFKPSRSYSKRVDGKTYIYNESSIGPEVPAALALMSTGMSSSQRSAAPVAPTSGPEVSAPKKPEAVPEPAAELEATVRNMRHVRTGLVIYKSQFKRVPATLAELTKPTDSFPNGFIEGGELPTDGWGRAFVYSARENGAKFDLRSMGPNGVDDQGSGDDVSLP